MEENGVKLVCFEFCAEKFAFNMDYLVEIVQIQPADITPFFSHSPLLRGKWTYRKRTIAIIDLRDFFGLGERGGLALVLPAAEGQGENVSAGKAPAESAHSKNFEHAPPSKSVLVVNIRGQTFGILTDTVLYVVPLGVFYEYPGMISTLPKKYFAGITIINGEVILILAIEEFINGHELESELTINN
jgi:chemotaxis signal transduction protein